MSAATVKTAIKTVMKASANFSDPLTASTEEMVDLIVDEIYKDVVATWKATGTDNPGGNTHDLSVTTP